MKNSKTIQSLPLLKNGSCAKELKSCSISNMGKIIISNTCAFDTITSILMVAYCDSNEYNSKVDECDNSLLKFIAGLVKNGINSRTYSNRADLMVI
jgi:hypothetical protein